MKRARILVMIFLLPSCMVDTNNGNVKWRVRGVDGVISTHYADSTLHPGDTLTILFQKYVILGREK